MKNTLPKKESFIEKGDFQYSNNCNTVKEIASRRVITNEQAIAAKSLPARNKWWHQVNLTPLPNKIIVFNKGIDLARGIEMSVGGQVAPVETSGDKLSAANLKKKEKKNITSLAINHSIELLIAQPISKEFAKFPLS